MTFKDYANEVCEYELLTRDQEEELAKRVEQGDQEAQETLVKCNLRLVMKIAHQFGKFDMYEDIVSAGNLGLIEAAKRYRAGTGAKFSTYASNWIKAKIRKYISGNYMPVTMPHSFAVKRYHARREYAEMCAEGKKGLAEFCKRHRCTEWYGRMLLNGISSFSLDAPAYNSDGREMDVLDTFDPDTDKDRHEEENKDNADWLGRMVRNANSILDDRERDVLASRFGIGGRGEMTCREIADRYGLTHQRVQQIEKTALKKLKMAMARKED